MPRMEDMIPIEQYERVCKRKFTEMDVEELADKVVWMYVKWQDLQYEACELRPVQQGYCSGVNIEVHSLRGHATASIRSRALVRI